MISDFGTLFLLINVFTSVWHAEGLVNRLLNFCNEKFVIIVKYINYDEQLKRPDFFKFYDEKYQTF